MIDKDFINDLIKDTKFVMADEGSLMSSGLRVSTPIYAINCIYGGGIPLNLITRISGHPGSGKSTFSYQCMANYQKEYEDGVSVIYDMEASMDNNRLQTLGVNTSNVLRLPATTLQEAFSNMFSILNKLVEKKKDIPNLTTFQVYDTLSTGGTDKQRAEAEKGNNVFGAGTMMEAPRIIKQNLSNLFTYLEQIPMFIGLLEQVFTQPGMYTSTVAASGNFALKHDSHIHIVFGAPKDEYDRGFMIGTSSYIKLDKSKLSPKFVDIPCYIDSTRGGRIDEVESFARYISTDNVGIIKASSWWSITDTINIMKEKYKLIDNIDDLAKSYRKAEFMKLLREDSDLVDLLQVRFIDFIDDELYPAQREINNSYQLELINRCKYIVKEETDITEDNISLENKTE